MMHQNNISLAEKADQTFSESFDNFYHCRSVKTTTVKNLN
jgi:hypothetical protein